LSAGVGIKFGFWGFGLWSEDWEKSNWMRIGVFLCKRMMGIVVLELV
jgi:hypothetical protein